MDFELIKITSDDIIQYKTDMQEAFQKGFEDVYGKCDEIILPEVDIDRSLNSDGAVAYKAMVDGQMVGGAVVVINEETQHNHLDILYVKYGVQSKGIGKMIWDKIEEYHAETVIWETCTPCFEKRNLHFYVNKCGFAISEIQNDDGDKNMFPDDFIGDGGEGMYIFKKIMKCDKN